MRAGGVGGTRAGAGRLGSVAGASGLALLLLVGLAGCGPDEEAPESHSEPTAPDGAAGDEEDSTTTEPERADTPPTSYAPDTVEGEIEAAYLQSWRTFEDAVVQADLDLLANSYGAQALSDLTAQAQDLLDAGQSVRIDVNHDLVVTVVAPDTAAVTDVYQNHSVTLDRQTGDPSEPDPDEEKVRTFTLSLEDDGWVVTEIIDSSPQG